MYQPKCSFIMTTRNGYSKGPKKGEWLHRAIDSCISQNYSRCELVIHDDCSIDDTEDVLACYQAEYPNVIIIRSDPGVGICAGLNRAAQFASGRWLFIQDDDDISVSGRLRTSMNLVEQLAREQGVIPGIIGSSVAVIDNIGNVISEFTHSFTSIADVRNEFITHSRPQIGVIGINKSVWEILGGFNERWTIAGDYDFMLRAIENNIDIAIAAEILYHYRTATAGNQWSVSAQHSLTHFCEMQAIYSEFHNRQKHQTPQANEEVTAHA